MLFATGLDANRSTVFIQSHVPAHTEAAWLLGSVSSYGELRRMTQFKDKADRQDFVSAGLFSYPVLQAADILLYQTDAVPVGEDQRQHIELARNVAERFNQRYGQTLVVPEMIAPSVGGRIMDLQEPERKMSTTGGTSQGTIKLLDEPDVIRKKFKTAVTDSGSEIRRAEDKPGISNLIEIMSVATDKSMEEIESEFDGQGYGSFKEAVGEAVVELLDADPDAAPRAERRPARAAAAAGDRRREGAPGVRADAERHARPHGHRPLRGRPHVRRGAAARRALTERVDFVAGELAPLPRRQAVDREPRVGRAVQTADGMADGLAHPLHLVLAALVERQLEPRRAEAADPGGRGAAVLQVDSGGEPGDRLVGRLALDVGLVDLVHLVARVHEPVRELAVVREEERAGRVHVEPPDRDDAIFHA